MNNSGKRFIERNRRAERVRRKISGTSGRPRLCVRRSNTHIYADIVDDSKGVTLVAVSSTAKTVAGKISGKKKLTKTDVSKVIGEMVAEKALEKGISEVVFDRKGYLYHGRVKALAEAARGKGLVF